MFKLKEMTKIKLLILLLMLPFFVKGQVQPQWQAVGTIGLTYTYAGKSPSTRDTLWNSIKIRSFLNAVALHKTGNETASGFKTLTQKLTADTVSAKQLYSKTTINQGDSLWVTPTKRFYFFGDSWTVGQGASNNGLRYSTLVANGVNLKEINLGISGTRLQQVTVGDSSMRDRINRIPVYNSTIDSYLAFLYGVNDYRLAPANGADTASFTAQYKVVLNRAITTNGWPISKVIIGEPQYQNIAATATQRANWLIAFNRVVDAYPGIQVVRDQYAITHATRSAGYYYDADSLHINNVGHQLVGKQFLLNLSDSKMPNLNTYGRINAQQSLNVYRSSGDSTLMSLNNGVNNVFSVSGGVQNKIRLGNTTNGSTRTQLSLGNNFTPTTLDRTYPKLLLYGEGLGVGNYAFIDVNAIDGTVITNKAVKIVRVANSVLRADSAFVAATVSNFVGQMTAGAAIFSSTVNANVISRGVTTNVFQLGFSEGPALPYAANFVTGGTGQVNIANKGFLKLSATYAPTTGIPDWAALTINPTVNEVGTTAGAGRTYGIKDSVLFTARTAPYVTLQSNNTAAIGYFLMQTGDARNRLLGNTTFVNISAGKLADVVTANTPTAAATDSIMVKNAATLKMGAVKTLGVSQIDTVNMRTAANSYSLAGAQTKINASITAMFTTNNTTLGLSSATLNATYPSAPLNYQVICDNITLGGAIYVKATGTKWLTVSAPVTP